jgi:hypothetical protein
MDLVRWFVWLAKKGYCGPRFRGTWQAQGQLLEGDPCNRQSAASQNEDNLRQIQEVWLSSDGRERAGTLLVAATPSSIVIWRIHCVYQHIAPECWLRNNVISSWGWVVSSSTQRISAVSENHPCASHHCNWETQYISSTIRQRWRCFFTAETTHKISLFLKMLCSQGGLQGSSYWCTQAVHMNDCENADGQKLSYKAYQLLSVQ